MKYLFVAIWAIFAALSPVFVPIAQAQVSEMTAPDYAAWEVTATRAEDVIGSGRASTNSLETLRSELVTWREMFLVAQDANGSRIDTLKTQIAALGAAPEDGGSETPEIAARRTELNGQLARLEAPRRSAEEAYKRADGLISEIDRVVRDRQADALLTLDPTPLNPAIWPAALADVASTAEKLRVETTTAWASDVQRSTSISNLPATILLTLAAFLFLLRGRRWSVRLTTRLRDRPEGLFQRGGVFIMSLGQIALPVVGVFLLAAAIRSTGLLGLRGTTIVDQIPWIGITFFAARWLGSRLFPKIEVRTQYFDMTPERRSEGRFYSGALGLMLGLNGLSAAIQGMEDYTPGSFAVLNLPLVIVSGLMLVRFGQLLRTDRTGTNDEAGPSFRGRAVQMIGRLAVGAGIVAPILAAIGYTQASQALIFPAINTLALLGLLMVLIRLVTEIYALITKKSEEDVGEALGPVLIGFGMVIAALPVLALIWGARVSDLTELWTRFKGGFAIGDSRISPTDFLTFAIVFAIGYALTRMLQATLENVVLPKTKMDVGGRNAITSGTGYIGIFLAAVIAITAAGIDLSSLAIVAGALSVGIGFGLQNIVSNFVSGIILLIERPISEGDWIEVGGQMGYVRDISVRSTRIETFDRTDVIVPNADLVSGMVTNYTRGNLIGRVIVPVGVAYGTDTMRVDAILREIVENHPMVSLNPMPNVLFTGFGADSLDFEIRALLRDVNFNMAVKSELNHSIAKRFADEGIEIPFAQRDIWLRNPEVLGAGSGAAAVAAVAAEKPKAKRKSSAKKAAPKLADNPAWDEDDGDSR